MLRYLFQGLHVSIAIIKYDIFDNKYNPSVLNVHKNVFYFNHQLHKVTKTKPYSRGILDRDIQSFYGNTLNLTPKSAETRKCTPQSYFDFSVQSFI